MRISRPQMYMLFAETAAKRSTCFRASVGAILVLDNNVISVGYNGPPSKEPHCQGNECPLTHSGGCSRSLHAEWNALRRSGLYRRKNTVGLLDLYCTHSPCEICAGEINKYHVDRLFYKNSYRMEALDLLTDTLVYRMTDSGYIIDRSGQIVEIHA